MWSRTFDRPYSRKKGRRLRSVKWDLQGHVVSKKNTARAQKG